jgi:AraC family transcriptional regulator
MKFSTSSDKYKYLHFPEINVTKKTTFYEIIQSAYEQMEGVGLTYEPEKQLIISLLLSGEMIYQSEGNEYLVKNNDIIITNPYEEHMLMLPHTQLKDLISISLHNVQDALEHMLMDTSFLYRNHPKHGKVIYFRNRVLIGKLDTLNLMKRLINLSVSDYSPEKIKMLNEVYCRQIFYSLLESEVLHYFGERKSSQTRITQDNVQERLEHVMEYLYTHYTESMGLDQMAAVAGLNKNYFIRLFRSIIGMSPYQYLLEIRIEKAKELLLNTQMSISEIAFIVGFKNPTSFNSSFQKKTGKSPSQFRQQGVS